MAMVHALFGGNMCQWDCIKCSKAVTQGEKEKGFRDAKSAQVCCFPTAAVRQMLSASCAEADLKTNAGTHANGCEGQSWAWEPG